MGVDSLTPLQEEVLESFVGWSEAYVHQETEELAKDQDAVREMTTMSCGERTTDCTPTLHAKQRLVSSIRMYRNHDLTLFRSKKRLWHTEFQTNSDDIRKVTQLQS